MGVRLEARLGQPAADGACADHVLHVRRCATAHYSNAIIAWKQHSCCLRESFFFFFFSGFYFLFSSSYV